MLQKEAAEASLGRSDRKSVAVGVCVNTGPLTQRENTQMYMPVKEATLVDVVL